MNTGPSSKLSDRLFGFAITLTGGVALYVLREWLIGMRNRRKMIERQMDVAEAIRSDIDELYSVRYALLEKIHHFGACHCERVQFKIRAPKVLNAFDIHSKVRFPRIMIKGEDFENLTDENLLSLYAVTNHNGNGKSIGIHAFCSYCGVHILYSPSEDPKEVQINVDCLDDKTIEKINVSYYGSSDLVPCSLSDNRAKQYTRRGTGGGAVPSSVISNLSDSESVSDLRLPRTTDPIDLMDDIDDEGPLGRSSFGGGRGSRLNGRAFDDALLIIEDCELDLDNDDVSNSACGDDVDERMERYMMTPSRGVRVAMGTEEGEMSDTSGSGVTTATYSSTTTATMREPRPSSSSHTSHLLRREMHTSSVSSSSGKAEPATPTSSLHRRLRTHLYRHMPDRKSSGGSVGGGGSSVASRRRRSEGSRNQSREMSSSRSSA